MYKGQKNWDYSHSDNSYPVVHAFIAGSDSFNNFPLLKQKLATIQQVESNNHLRGGIVNLYNPIDTGWLIACKNMGYRYACVWFDGVWADTEDFNMRLLDEIDRINNSADKGWFCAGQIMEEGYPYFYRSLILINIQAWYDNEQPSPFIEPSELPDYQTIPELDWEDSLFGVYPKKQDHKLRDFSNFSSARLTRFANSWIAWSLRRRLTVPGFSEEFMEEVIDVKPHVGTEQFDHGLRGLPYDKSKVSYRATRIIDFMNAKSPIYFVNTEASKPEIVEQLEGTGFEQYVGPCAGFKLLYYAYKYGFNSNTRFVFYDFDEDSVQFKKDLFAEWHGQDLDAWVEAWCKANPGKNTDLQYLVAERWPSIVEQFGGQKSWLHFWNSVRECDVRIIRCDLVNSSDDLIGQLASVKTLLWTSNIYSYVIAKMAAQPFQLEVSFMNLVNALNKFPDSWFVGTDINDNELMCPSTAITTIGENYNIGFE